MKFEASLTKIQNFTYNEIGWSCQNPKPLLFENWNQLSQKSESLHIAKLERKCSRRALCENAEVFSHTTISCSYKIPKPKFKNSLQNSRSPKFHKPENFHKVNCIWNVLS